jgi:hypothetical protein
MSFPGVSQPESNDYFPPLAKIPIADDHVFVELFSIIAFWYARMARHVILHNLREKSADDLNFWLSYCNFCPLPVTSYFPSYLTLGRVRKDESRNRLHNLWQKLSPKQKYRESYGNFSPQILLWCQLLSGRASWESGGRAAILLLTGVDFTVPGDPQKIET